MQRNIQYLEAGLQGRRERRVRKAIPEKQVPRDRREKKARKAILEMRDHREKKVIREIQDRKAKKAPQGQQENR